MGNAAIDYERQEALNAARMQPPRADDFSVPRNGRSDDYFQNGSADEYEDDDSYEDLDENNHAERLDKARRGSDKSEAEKAKELAKDAAKLATPMGAFSLLKQIDFLGDIPYAAALGAAILKDLLDLVFIGSLPGIGTVITICCSIFITMMFFLAGVNDNTAKKARRLAKSKTFQKTVIRMLAVITGTIIEFVPGIDFFPVESAIVAIVYTWTLMDRKKNQQTDMQAMDNDGDEIENENDDE